MSHTYPIGASVRAALEDPTRQAQTRYQAEALTQASEIIAGLETEWLSCEVSDYDALAELAQSHPASGFVQAYEDYQGQPVLAITFWKTEQRSRQSLPQRPALQTDQPAPADHTDDLYFRQGRTGRNKRRKPVNPDQLDLFSPGADKAD